MRIRLISEGRIKNVQLRTLQEDYLARLKHFIDLSIDIMSGIRIQPGAPRHLGGSNRTIIKQAFDPSAVFNPGVKIPVPGQRALDVVKYDPALDPLPPAAREALRTVERERAYSRFRLDLL